MRRKYYTPIQVTGPDGDKVWIFWIPEKHGPFPDEGHGDIQVGTYASETECYTVANGALLAAYKAGYKT